MIIRKALLEDSKTVAVLLLTAMEEIVYSFIGTKNHELALELLTFFVEREDNQYSYQNCFVAEENDKIIGAVNIYDGARLQELRAPVVAYIKDKFNADFNPEDETENGEFYIDSLGVDSEHQGKGIGSQILRFLIDDYVIKKNQILGLLVEEGNQNAKKLYVRLGFQSVGHKKLAGKNLEHLQLKH